MQPFWLFLPLMPDDLHLVVRPNFVSAYPMYPNVLFVRSEQVLCVLLAVLLLEACTTRASVHRFAWQDVAL